MDFTVPANGEALISITTRPITNSHYFKLTFTQTQNCLIRSKIKYKIGWQHCFHKSLFFQDVLIHGQKIPFHAGGRFH